MSEKKGRKKCDLNENENDVLDLPSLEIVTFEESSFRLWHTHSSAAKSAEEKN